jgi:hypothetical protein
LGDSEGLAAKATGVVLRTTLVCPLVPVTPLVDAYFAIAMTPVLAPLDLMLTRQCDGISRAAIDGTDGAVEKTALPTGVSWTESQAPTSSRRRVLADEK